MHLKLSLLVIIVLSCAFLPIHQASESLESEYADLIVTLSNGKLRGRDMGNYYSYESIPYAEAPIGALRLEAPKPYTQKWSNVFNATESPRICMQWNQFTEGDNKLIGVEDCLTVNIYKPKNAKKTFPVVVYIHGGAFMFGGVNADGVANLMRTGNVIVVKFTYRLGPLGFLSTEDTILPGNYGLKDQRLALKWIKTNIVNFGGEADNILVVGFSAGAASVHLQLLQPEFKNYAKVAASLSGTAFNPWVITHNARARAFELAKSLNCSNLENSPSLKECLKAASAAQIVSAVRNFLVFDYMPFTTFGPVIELPDATEAFLTQTPTDIITSGNFSQIPWLASYTAQDGIYNAAILLQRSPGHKEELIEVLNERWYDLAPYMLFYKDAISTVEGLDDYSVALKQRYLGDKQFSVETYPAVEQMFTDILFKNGIEKAVDLHRKFGTSPVYAYVYDNPGHEGAGQILSKRTDISFGTAHGNDLYLIFNYKYRATELRADEKIISLNLITMIENFVATESGDLRYDSCQFIDNVGNENFQLMNISRNACENIIAPNFP